VTKRRPALHPDQLGFTFEAPTRPARSAGLAGLERQVASAVSYALKDDLRTREEIAGAVTALIDQPVSRFMLDAYASEARDQHSISFTRFLAIIVVTNRYDLLDTLLRQTGAALLVGEEIHTARVGDIEARIAMLHDELKAVKRLAQPIGRSS
jgi:hypothetical protein